MDKKSRNQYTLVGVPLAPHMYVGLFLFVFLYFLHMEYQNTQSTRSCEDKNLLVYTSSKACLRVKIKL